MGHILKSDKERRKLEEKEERELKEFATKIKEELGYLNDHLQSTEYSKHAVKSRIRNLIKQYTDLGQIPGFDTMQIVRDLEQLFEEVKAGINNLNSQEIRKHIEEILSLDHSLEDHLKREEDFLAHAETEKDFVERDKQAY